MMIWYGWTKTRNGWIDVAAMRARHAETIAEKDRYIAELEETVRGRNTDAECRSNAIVERAQKALIADGFLRHILDPCGPLTSALEALPVIRDSLSMVSSRIDTLSSMILLKADKASPHPPRKTPRPAAKVRKKR